MKRLLLVSLGLMSVGLYVGGCLPDSSTTPPTTGTAGTYGGTAGTNGDTGTAGTSQTGTAGTNGDTGTAGTNGNTGTAGTGDAGTNGNPTGTAGTNARGGTTGQGGGGTTGQGGRGGTGQGGAAGTSALGGRGGTGQGGGGAAGTSARGGTTGTAGGGATGTAGTGAGGATGNVVCDSLKQQLDGFEYLLACGPTQGYSPLVCQNPAGTCPGGTEYLVRGHQNMDKKITIGGTSSQSCTITLHVQGVVEPKHYNRCTTYFGAATEGFAQGPANGGATSGCYPSTSGDYNVYMMHVSDNTTLLGNTLTGTRYFLNAINQNEAHFSYKIDYTTPSITIKGGSTIWLLANDSNCSAIKNCANTSQDGTTATSGRCDPLTVANVTPAPGAAITQPYNGQFILFHVASAQ